jgi:fatty-acyl-CoA synthase
MGSLHLSSWPPGVPRELSAPATSIWSNLEASAARVPDRRAIVFYDGVLTYADLARECERLAGYLQRECGVKKGDRVALYMQNSPQWVIAYYAILRADAVVVPVNPMNLTEEVKYMLEDSGAEVLLASQEVAPHVTCLVRGPSPEPPTARPELPLRRLIVAAYSDYVGKETDLVVPEVMKAAARAFDQPGVVLWTDALGRDLAPHPHTAGPDDLCVLPYTSGTTGHPKGCMHTHATVMHVAVAGPNWKGTLDDDECILSVLPFFHVTGMQNSMNSVIWMAGTIVVLPRWDRGVAAQLIERYRVTGWTAVPTMVVDLLSSPDVAKYDLSSIRMMGGGGAAMPEAIAQKLQDVYGLTYVEGYGLSETIAATHVNPVHKAKKQCLGIPIFGVDSRVVDPETLAELPPGKVGEIVTCGPQVFKGYWNKPDANAECFVQIEGKRFFRTGDLGRVDEEGYFFLVDRLKRMINASGFKVWPAEVEAMLYAHPSVQEAAIISTKDARRGESVKAVVVHKEGSPPIEEASFIAWCQSRMAAYKVPRSVEVVSSLPKTGSGKIMWRVLQEQEDRRAAG